MLSHKMGLERLVEVTSALPAKMLGVYPKKGAIEQGSDADIVILDAEGAPKTVIAAGKVVVNEDREVNVELGTSKYVEALPWPKVCYDRVKERETKREALRPVDRTNVNEDFIDQVHFKEAHADENYKQACLFQRPLSKHGVRNQQDSSFSLSEDRWEEIYHGKDNTGIRNVSKRATVKVNAPPGGQSRALW